MFSACHFDSKTTGIIRQRHCFIVENGNATHTTHPNPKHVKQNDIDSPHHGTTTVLAASASYFNHLTSTNHVRIEPWIMHLRRLSCRITIYAKNTVDAIVYSQTSILVGPEWARMFVQENARESPSSTLREMPSNPFFFLTHTNEPMASLPQTTMEWHHRVACSLNAFHLSSIANIYD